MSNMCSNTGHLRSKNFHLHSRMFQMHRTAGCCFFFQFSRSWFVFTMFLEGSLANDLYQLVAIKHVKQENSMLFLQIFD